MSIYSREGEETKRRILVAAKKEFAAKGFSGARMSSIAATAGVNQALIHYYFSSKENIYRKIFQRLIGDISGIYSERFRNEINSWDAGADLKLCGAIFILVNAELRVNDDEIYRIIAHEIADGKGIIHEFVKEYLVPELFSFDEIIKEGVGAGIFEISDTILFSMNIISFIKDLAHGKDFLKDTGMMGQISGNHNDALYNFMIEFSFKALKPRAGEQNVPVLDEDKKNKLNSILKEISRDMNKM